MIREVVQGQIWTASLRDTEELVSPEAMGAYAGRGIRCVLTVAEDVRPRCVAMLPQLCLPVNEVEVTPLHYFDLACQFHLTFGPILVHCNAGVNRSTAFAAALCYRVWAMGLAQAIRAADAVPGFVLRSMEAWAAAPLREGA